MLCLLSYLIPTYKALQKSQNARKIKENRGCALIYPVMATAADYFPEDAVVVLSESPRVAERGKSYLWQLGEDAKALMERGELAGELADFARTFEELTEVLADWPVCYQIGRASCRERV